MTSKIVMTQAFSVIQELFTISHGLALSEALIGIWLSTKTSGPKIRKKLLGMYRE